MPNIFDTIKVAKDVYLSSTPWGREVLKFRDSWLPNNLPFMAAHGGGNDFKPLGQKNAPPPAAHAKFPPAKPGVVGDYGPEQPYIFAPFRTVTYSNNGYPIFDRTVYDTGGNPVHAPGAPRSTNGAIGGGRGYGPATAFMFPMQLYNAVANSYNQMEQAGTLPSQRQPAPGAPQNYAPPSDVPRGVDAQWWNQFAQEHNGQTPEQFYRRDGEYAVSHALADKAWGDQFFRAYGRAPSDYDWKASYAQRQRAFYGG